MDTFIILKNNNKKSDKEPDYRITANVGSKEQPVYRDIAAGWKKEGEKGTYISCKFSKPYGDKKGYQITELPNPIEIPSEDGEIPF